MCEDELNTAYGTAVILNTICGNFLDLESPSKRWKVRETSVSDLIIAHFQNTSSAEISVDASDELRTSADLEIAFQGKYNFITYLQAKRSTKNKDTYSCKEINHKVGKNYQVKLLHEYCKAQTVKHCVPHIPFYLFYHGNYTSNLLKCSNLTVGWIDKALEYATKGQRWKLLCQDHQVDGFPFPDLFLDPYKYLISEHIKDFSEIEISKRLPTVNQTSPTTQQLDSDLKKEPEEPKNLDNKELNLYEMAASIEAKNFMESYRKRFHEPNFDRHIDVGEETPPILPYRRILIHS